MFHRPRPDVSNPPPVFEEDLPFIASDKESELPKAFDHVLMKHRNDPCGCGSGQKLKKCCARDYDLTTEVYTGPPSNSIVVFEEDIDTIAAEPNELTDAFEVARSLAQTTDERFELFNTMLANAEKEAARKREAEEQKALDEFRPSWCSPSIWHAF